MKVKTSKLDGPALDWAVAKCEGVNAEVFRLFYDGQDCAEDFDGHGYPEFHYSTIWAQGGPIIKREGISLHHKWYNGEWHATKQVDPCHPDLPGSLHQITRWHEFDPLIAAMRCYVASKLGDEVDIPKDLI